MKKVDEGVEIFDEIWEKVQEAEQQNQKEKHETDLKKEIKKLQRLRDQIKTWIGSTDVKDKDALVEARKLIETKMEQFKICEKQTKTKAYSKEGLAQVERLDPAEEAKRETTTWLSEYSEKLTEMVEEIDFEIEKLSSGKGKKTNKHQIEELQERIANHKFHISKLEGIIRLVNNDRLGVEPVDQMKEDLDYYLESYEDEDYMAAYDEEYIYDSLGLDELDVVNVDRVTQAPPAAKKSEDTASSSSRKEKKSSKKTAVASGISLKIGRAISTKDKKKEDEEKATPTKASRTTSTSSIKSIEVPPPVKPATPAPPGGASMAAILKRESEQQEKERQKVRSCRTRLAAHNSRLTHPIQREQQARAQAEQLRQQQALEQQEAQLRQQEALRERQQQEALKRQQAEVMRQQEAAKLQAEKAQQAQANGKGPNGLDTLTSGLGGLGLGDDRSQAGSVSLAGSTHTSQTMLQSEGGAILPTLNESLSLAPDAGEKERSRSYTPQNPYPTPNSYPTGPSGIFENPAVFEKLGTDCLFFIFYYAQGTYQQYLAARELKKQSWRFHKKYMTWFQRHEEPKVTTDEYEQGTYVYFDYETGWCTRIKTDFRFEYSYLEDTLQ